MTTTEHTDILATAWGALWRGSVAAFTATSVEVWLGVAVGIATLIHTCYKVWILYSDRRARARAAQPPEVPA